MDIVTVRKHYHKFHDKFCVPALIEIEPGSMWKARSSFL